MKTRLKNHWKLLGGPFGLISVVIAIRLGAQSLPAPGVTIARTSTNEYLISITNGITNAVYSVYSTLELGNAAYPWTLLTNGTPGVTNFSVSVGARDLADFFEVEGSFTNAIPTWELADPNNPGLGVLTVTIVSPTNNSVIQ